MTLVASPFDLHAHPDYDGHESVTFVNHAQSGLRAIIAIHRLGEPFAAGGIRMMSYADANAALTDVLRLSRTMTYKLAFTGLSVTGAKSVIMGNPNRDKTPALLRAFADAVNRHNGAYCFAGDIGIQADDLAILGRYSEFGAPPSAGDLSDPTAQGVLQAIKGGVKYSFGRDNLDGLTVAVQGLGQVGERLCHLLFAEGCRLVIADINVDICSRVAQKTGAQVTSPEEILSVTADVISPCAVGGVLNSRTIPSIQARLICGAANNQLADPEAGAALKAGGIDFVPDFVASAGGAIGGLQEACSYSDERKSELLCGIYHSSLKVLNQAAEQGVTTTEAAEAQVRAALA